MKNQFALSCIFSLIASYGVQGRLSGMIPSQDNGIGHHSVAVPKDRRLQGSHVLVFGSSTFAAGIEAKTNLVDILVGLGNTVTDGGNSLPPPVTLTQFDEIWHVGTDPLSTSDMAGIVTYVQEGGGVYLSGENSGLCCRELNTALEALLNVLVEGGGIIAGGTQFLPPPQDPYEFNPDAVGSITSTPNVLTNWVSGGSGPGGLDGLNSKSNILLTDTVATDRTIIGGAWECSDIVGSVGQLVVIMDLSWLLEPAEATMAVENFDEFMTRQCSVEPITSSPTTLSPIDASQSPSIQPSIEPSVQPSVEPSGVPSMSNASDEPSSDPAPQASSEPSTEPTVHDSGAPTIQTSVEPSSDPTVQASSEPTVPPTNKPTTDVPSLSPSSEPTLEASDEPTIEASEEPSVVLPSDEPSISFSEEPSIIPSEQPSLLPSVEPTKLPSSSPSVPPSAKPSPSPTKRPTSRTVAPAAESLPPVPSPTPAPAFAEPTPKPTRGKSFKDKKMEKKAAATRAPHLEKPPKSSKKGHTSQKPKTSKSGRYH